MSQTMRQIDEATEYVVRLVGPDERDRLRELEDFLLLERLPAPETLQVLVVEERSPGRRPRFVGYWALTMVPHAEPLFLPEALRRNTRVKVELLDAMLALLEETRTESVVIISDNERIADTARHVFTVDRLGEAFRLTPPRPTSD